MATDLQERKIELIQWLSVIDDIALLKKIADIKEQSTNDWWDDISDREKASVDKGIADADEGRLNLIPPRVPFMKSNYKVVWTDHALDELRQTIYYLEDNFSTREIQRLGRKI